MYTMRRLQKLSENLGRWGRLKVVGLFAVLLFGSILFAAMSMHQPLPLICLLIGAAVPTLGRGSLVSHPEQTRAALRLGWWVFVLTMLAAPLLGDLSVLGHSGQSLTLVTTTGGLYLTAAFWFWSDDSIHNIDGSEI